MDLAGAAPPPEPSGPAGRPEPADLARQFAGQGPAGQGPAGQGPPIRVGDRERDAVAHRLQDAFAEGRLDDDEFDQRMRAALTARMSTELDVLTADLPVVSPRPASPAPAQPASPKPGRLALAYKGSVRRGGRWRVPARFTSVIYKGSARIDLRAAELTAPVTTMIAVAYKSHIDVLVPLGVRIDLEGFGVSKAWSAEEDMERLVPADAPVVHVRGVAYKGTIEVSTRPPGANPQGG
jgi:Domain of unknown function (DUF1707)